VSLGYILIRAFDLKSERYNIHLSDVNFFVGPKTMDMLFQPKTGLSSFTDIISSKVLITALLVVIFL
jgi:hypothetical protein